MLNHLHQIVTEVASARTLDEALKIIVARVKHVLELDVCSIYLSDDNGQTFVLMASDGLNPASVGRVRLQRNEGIVGLVAERQEPVHLQNASDHPRFIYFPMTGEERYRSFLGVPIIHYRKVLGVLVAQQRDDRLFDSDESAFLVTIAAQLAGAIQHAAATGGISRLLTGQSQELSYLQAISGTPGVAIGTVALAWPTADLEAVPDRPTDDPHAEEAAFRIAVAAVQDELQRSGARMAPMLKTEERALFDVHVMLLGSRRLIDDVVSRIRGGLWAPAALRDTFTEHAQVFEQMEDPYLRARAEDLRDIGRRVLLRLQSGADEVREYPPRCILLGEEVSIAQVAEVPTHSLIGIVSARGSAFSHTAVLARALGVPAVMGFEDLPFGQLEGVEAIVDGYQARLFIQPAGPVLQEFQRLAQEQDRLSEELKELRYLPSETTDGMRVGMLVNTGLLSDVTPSLESGAEGVGLYRTEIPFMVRDAFPGEDEQFEIYRKVLAAFSPRPVTMRTLDVGGDKPLPYFTVEEANPFLGWRGIRIMLDHPEIFLAQLRAMLRANLGLGNLHILLPMITGTSEIEESLNLLHRAREGLLREGQDVPMPPIGAMIEVPAAVYQARAIAERVDFLSIGTNDLTQYMLAVDRNNARIASLYDGMHPAVLAAVEATVVAGHAAGKPVSLCGELAADPGAVILAVGMGIDVLSMASSAILRAKWVVRSFSKVKACKILDEVRQLDDAASIRSLLNRELEHAGLGDLVRKSGS